MIQRLLIKNYAIIDELDIRFSTGLNIITGETGAGKSILLGALSLILGERADLSALFDREKKCVIEGIFEMPAHEPVVAFFRGQELDIEPQITIRREISAAGKTRAFVNDTPVTLQQLSLLSGLLVDLHQQFDTLQLGREDFQREVLDVLAGHASLLPAYRAGYREWQQYEKRLEDLSERSRQAGKELDYHQFLFDELAEAGFSENELERLDAELTMLAHSEEVQSTLGSVHEAMEAGEEPLVQKLKQLQQALQHIQNFHPALGELVQRLHSTAVELEDIADELLRLQAGMNLDAERMNIVNDRLELGHRLLKKHGVQTTADLLNIQAELSDKLQQATSLDEQIAQVAMQRDEALKSLQALAGRLSEGRKKQVPAFEKNVNALLKKIGMPGASLKVQVTQESLQADGQDRVEFLFDANHTGRFLPVAKVASGGELSRLMLCIKSLVAGSMVLPTLIFDEIDTGISGEAAKQAGAILKDLSTGHQVICITHQPQIAGRADAHYFVFKESRNGKAYTNIRLLNKEDRISTIAQMLSGEKPSQAALENAREMVEG